jgi:hypothetical protein
MGNTNTTCPILLSDPFSGAYKMQCICSFIPAIIIRATPRRADPDAALSTDKVQLIIMHYSIKIKVKLRFDMNHP